MAFAVMLGILEAVEEEDIMMQNSALMKSLGDDINPFNMIDRQFIKIFRLSKDAVHYLCNVLQLPLQRTRSNGLSIETQVLAALSFFAIGSYQKAVGNDYLVSLSQPTVSRAIKAVILAINQLIAKDWIQFPKTEEKRAALKRRFQEEKNFKGVIGCIDCTHIAIVRPKEHEEAYANHKGFHSINVQAVASHDLEILSINARFPGTVHDSFIWKNSAVREEMIRLWDSGNRSTWLLGDSGYPLEPWLMTPIINAPEESAEARYTQCHSSTRNCVERMFGLLKNVWRCLLGHRVLHYDLIMAANITVACAVLHNIRLNANIMHVEFDIDEEGEAEAQQRALLPNNIQVYERIRVQAAELAGADVEHYVNGDKMAEARRIQRQILRTQFGLRNM